MKVNIQSLIPVSELTVVTTQVSLVKCIFTTQWKWKTDFIDHSLNHLIEVWELFSSHYLMPDTPPTALLSGNHLHNSGSLVTWLIPSGLTPSLISRAQIDSDFFRQHCILRMTVEGKCVYEEVTMVSFQIQCSCCLLHAFFKPLIY